MSLFGVDLPAVVGEIDIDVHLDFELGHCRRLQYLKLVESGEVVVQEPCRWYFIQVGSTNSQESEI